MADSESLPARSQIRTYLATMVIGTALALALGQAFQMRTQVEANDISRWCTVWSLLERGGYAIDDCPWQSKTQDKVKRPDPFARVAPGATPAEHFYSSKPPLLPTLIAGMLYPFRVATGVPLDRVMAVPREPRWVQKEVAGSPGTTQPVLETPQEPIKWSSYVYYFKPMIIFWNIVPLGAFLILYARRLDRLGLDDWPWLFCLIAAAFGSLLFVFNQTLNNHTVAAYSAFFGLEAFMRVWDGESRRLATFAAAGFFTAFCATNELPAALFAVVLFALLCWRLPRQTFVAFVPAAALPCAAFLATQYLAFGQFRPVYEEFGTKSYEYYGSYWNTPLEMDWFNKHPEPYAVYLGHMTIGHHGVFSLTPIFLLSIYGALRRLRGRSAMTAVAWLTCLLTAAMLAFYTWNPKARNYGGSTQGLRWLFWLIPFWLITLPEGVRAAEQRPWLRRLSLAALFVSIFSVGYAMRNPWSHPWMLDLLEHLGFYSLKR